MSASIEQVDFHVAGIRIGTLRTYPVVESRAIEDGREVKKTAPFWLTSKGAKFVVALKDNQDQPDLSIRISAKRIKHIKAHLLRGCPVIWILTDKLCAERIRSQCKLTDPSGAYFDPQSPDEPEQRIAVITKQDPLPLTLSQNIQLIFSKLAKRNGVKVEDFFSTISHAECNKKLVDCIKYMENKKKSPESAMKKIYFKKNKSSESEWSDSSGGEDGGGGGGGGGGGDDSDVTDDCNDPDYRVVPKKGNMNKSFESSNSVKQRDVSSAMDIRVVAEEQNKDNAVSNANSGNTSHKVHRARKSIPNRHRAVSIESQLRARVEEQAAQDRKMTRSVDSNDLQIIQNKRKHSDDELSDVSGRPSGSESPHLPSESNGTKKKRPKDPFLWAGRKKKKKTSPNSTGSTSPSPESSENLNGNPDSNSQQAPTPTIEPEQSTTRKKETKTEIVQRNMLTLKQDMESIMRMTPLCTCCAKTPHSINFERAKDLRCMAIDYIGGRLYGCHSVINNPGMLRPSSKVPVIGLCDEHRERMIRHESCPGCGTFCCGGVFLVCYKNADCPHRFHRDCMVLTGHTSECPHCGGDLTSVREVNLTPNKDSNLMYMLAGQNAERMERRKFAESRGKSARMGHAPSVHFIPEKIPGVTAKLPSGIEISTTSLYPGNHRQELEEFLAVVETDTSAKKLRFQPKQFVQLVKQSDLGKVLQMLSEGFEKETHSPILDSALFEAIAHGSLSIVHLLIQCGADVNTRNDDGDTPLFEALHKRKSEVLFYLLVNNADVKLKDEEGMTCLHHAAKEGYVEGSHLLITYGKAKINSPDDGGWTPIVWAAEHKQATMARYLLHNGADVNVVDNEGNICLQWAALSGNLEILLMCLQAHSNIRHCNTHGDTALHIAAREDHYLCITALLAAGADPDIKNSEQLTPIECAPSGSMSWMSMKINSSIRNACLLHGTDVPFNRERILCKDMSRGYDKVPIVCVNAVDSTPCPTDPPNGFHYVTENVHTSQDTRIDAVISGIQSCRCTDSCETSSCVCGLISERCWYSKDGTLVPEFDILEPPLVFECSKMCTCSRTCTNRVVQNGIKYRLQVYRTRGMGWGLRALETIPRGAFVCDYVGELITDAEADVREDDSYLFDLENKDGEMFCIDARSYGNVSRFINHLCEPNLIPIRVFVDHHDIRFPRLAYFTTREIQPYEELGFDYGDRFWDVKCRQFTCQCSSPHCKYSEEAYKKKALQQAEAAEAAQRESKDPDDNETDT